MQTQPDHEYLNTQANQGQEPMNNKAPFLDLDSSGDALEDGRVTNLSFQRMMDLSFFVFNLIGTGLTVITLELIHYDQEREARKVMLWVIFISNLILMGIVVVRNAAKLKWRESKGDMYSGFSIEPLETSLEILIIAASPLPFLDDYSFQFENDFVEGEVYYYANELLCLTLAFRVIFFIRTTLLNSYWHSNRTDRVCSLYASQADYMFTIKSLMRNQPFTVNYSAMILLIVVFGYCLRICESPLNRIDISSNDFSSYANSMWCVIVTSTTLGYGDYYTRTLLGRIVMSVVCILGNFVVSSMIVIITNESYLSTLENKVVILIDRLSLKKQMQQEAAMIITVFGRIYYAKKYYIQYLRHLDFSEEQFTEMNKKMKKYAMQLKLTTRKYVAARALGSQLEEINSGFNSLKENLKQTSQLQEDLIKANENLINKIDNK
ncbi:unnamed protein product (macronuclear) [Paramecium tetraurelia]|uniref:Potassium channel domain-containing protein n=1 Tax=Paramecium tetraurelia TaxID=5888 RepID=A0DIY4_PARTE|nr:uncharacterized protein GSPATT00017358001 [Paramecium tetraurelia]CAK83001.1 unnamed protein product [Paramecium tetraurelia]|eukprot:XP_001450398.1 hypothetical protein (macronuclear) [Paramecium tetraurelia strain d4-2]